MFIGSLVILKNPWTLRGKQMGVIISKSAIEEDEICTVLWCKDSFYELKEHLIFSLVQLD